MRMLAKLPFEEKLRKLAISAAGRRFDGHWSVCRAAQRIRDIAKEMLLLTLLLLAGCWDLNEDGQKRVAFIGDSNTARCWFAGGCADKWVEFWQAENPTFIAKNWAKQGATTCPVSGHFHFDQQTTNALNSGTPYDVAVLASTANDFFFDGDVTPEEVFDCLLAVGGRFNDEGILAIPTLMPPLYYSEGDLEFDNERIEAFNDLVVESFDPLYIDFWTGFTSDLFSDGVHLNTAGHELRAERAEP